MRRRNPVAERETSNDDRVRDPGTSVNSGAERALQAKIIDLMRSPTSFNTSFLLSTWISVAFHGAVLLVGFWLCPDPAPRTPPKPVLDHGDNAVTIVWRSPVPRQPVLDVDPDEEELAPEAPKPAPEPKPEPVPEPEPETRIEATPEELEPVEEAPSVELAPIPLMSPLPAHVENSTTKRPTGSPSMEAPTTARPVKVMPVNALRSAPAPLRPALLENVKEEPPSEGNPGVRQEATLTSRLALRYPRSCRRRGHHGTVRLECRLSAAGNVVSVSVVSSSGCDKLDHAALDAIRSARFEPARVDGKPVAGTVVLPVEFRLR